MSERREADIETHASRERGLSGPAVTAESGEA